MSTPQPPRHPPSSASNPIVRGVVPPDGSEDVERIPTAECWTLLEHNDLGRLAVVRGDGSPDIFPVNYHVHEGALYLRSARDSKLQHIARHPAVAFEIDGTTTAVRWSIVLKGSARQLTVDAEIRDSGARELVTASPVRKHYVVKITPESVTGRRFAVDGGHSGAIAPPPAPVVAEVPDEPARADRPHPIAHHSPFPGGDGPGSEPTP